MRRIWVRFLGGLVLVALGGCGNFFADGVILGGPTVLASRENFSFQTETDQNNNTVYTYSYQIVLYALPGSGAGTVILLAASENQLEAPSLIPESCRPSNPDPCGPYTREVVKKSFAPLTPVQAVKYRTISANGQSKVVPLNATIELY